MRATLILLLALCTAAGCKEEPAIVIRFDAPDLATTSTDVARTDAAVRREASSDSECATDSDCTVEVDGCCDCANGGKQKAVSTKHERTAAKCDGACVMMMSTDPSCAKHAACVDGACGLRDSRKIETKRRNVLPKKPTP